MGGGVFVGASMNKGAQGPGTLAPMWLYVSVQLPALPSSVLSLCTIILCPLHGPFQQTIPYYMFLSIYWILILG